MSRGLGKVERGLIDAFTKHPSMTYTSKELAPIIYPDIARVQPKHRDAINRAMRKVLPLCPGWVRSPPCYTGAAIYYNSHNMRSVEWMRARMTWESAPRPKLPPRKPREHRQDHRIKFDREFKSWPFIPGLRVKMEEAADPDWIAYTDDHVYVGLDRALGYRLFYKTAHHPAK